MAALPSAGSSARVTGLRVRAVHLEVKQALETASGSFSTWPVVLLDVQTDAGVTGHAFLGCFLPMVLKPMVSILNDLSPLVAGESLSPTAIDRKLRARMRLIGVHGFLASAIAMVEIAAWDALGKATGQPVVRLLGGAPKSYPMYKTVVAMDPGKAAGLARQAIDAGYGGLKLKLGAPTLRADMALITSVRKAAGDDFPLMGDFNQVLSVPEAAERISVIDGEGLVWLEEPVAARNYAGCAQLARTALTPIQIGENWLSLEDAADSLAAQASDYVMPDLVKIGGAAAWLKAATLAEAQGVPVSAHSFPETCSHLMPATGNGHWLEHVGMADAVFRQPIRPTDGRYQCSEAPGFGMEWDEDTIGRFLVS